MGISNGFVGGTMIFGGTALVGDSMLPKQIDGIPGVSGSFSLFSGVTCIGIGSGMLIMGNSKDPIFGFNFILIGTAMLIYSAINFKLNYF